MVTIYGNKFLVEYTLIVPIRFLKARLCKMQKMKSLR